MVTIEEFVNEEINGFTKELLLTKIENGRKIKKYKEDVVFNKYSLEILFYENKVIIYDDLFIEDEPLKMDIDIFLKAISESRD